MSDGCTVVLTFDLDAEALWEGSYGVTTPSTLSRGAYGANLGMPRILALLERSGVSATFFVPGVTAERYPDLTRRIHDAGHEVAHHGYLHISPATQTEGEEREALEKGLEILLKLTGERPVGYRAPSWELSSRSLSLLSEYEFVYDSSRMDWESPYLVIPPLRSPPGLQGWPRRPRPGLRDLARGVRGRLRRWGGDLLYDAPADYRSASPTPDARTADPACPPVPERALRPSGRRCAGLPPHSMICHRA